MIVDDFGTEWIVGHFTGTLFPADQAVRAGCIMPSLPSSYFHWDIKDHHAARRQSYRDFCDICEQNCNTCKWLTRMPSKKGEGFLNGVCQRDNQSLRFHPEDPMHMKCYESRWDHV
jgi:hypothetical protein